MSQQFQVLCCYSCNMYQVHQIKKSNKWNCKVCNEKQSVKQIYGKGNGKECREHVQKLNMLSITKDSFQAEQTPEIEQFSHPMEGCNSNKWSIFLDDIDSDNTDDNEADFTSITKRRMDSSVSFRSNKKKCFEQITDIPNSSQQLLASSSLHARLDRLLVFTKQPSRPCYDPDRLFSLKTRAELEELSIQEPNEPSMCTKVLSPFLNRAPLETVVKFEIPERGGKRAGAKIIPFSDINFLPKQDSYLIPYTIRDSKSFVKDQSDDEESISRKSSSFFLVEIQEEPGESMFPQIINITSIVHKLVMAKARRKALIRKRWNLWRRAKHFFLSRRKRSKRKEGRLSRLSQESASSENLLPSYILSTGEEHSSLQIAANSLASLSDKTHKISSHAKAGSALFNDKEDACTQTQPKLLKTIEDATRAISKGEREDMEEYTVSSCDIDLEISTILDEETTDSHKLSGSSMDETEHCRKSFIKDDDNNVLRKSETQNVSQTPEDIAN